MNLTRRAFFATAGMTTATIASSNILSSEASAQEKSKSGNVLFDLGTASYSFRKFSVEKLIEWTKRADLKYVSIKDFHLPLNTGDEECARFSERFQEAGIKVYSCGVIYMNDEKSVENAFRYAQALGCVSIVGVPAWDLLPFVEKKVKETGILMAIHNHGPGDKLYPSAASIMEKVKDMDPGIGITLDIGHSVRINEDPAQVIRDFAPRIFDFHFKDMNKAAPEGKGVICGRGVIDLPGLVDALIEIGYNRVASFEYEIDEDDPFPGFMASVGYIRGLCERS